MGVSWNASSHECSECVGSRVGDEYLQFDAPLNPLVSHSAAFFWGFDEGFHIFGNITNEVSYIAQLRLDGETGNGVDDTTSKAAGIKVIGDHGRHWHRSLSYFDSGRAPVQELWIGRNVVGRLGATGAPGGASSSADIDADWFEANLKYAYDRGYVSAARGEGQVNDRIPTFSRDLEWFKSEALYRLSRRWYAAARYSGINVQDNGLQGYQFRSFETDGADLNFDVNELKRVSVGLGYRANEATTFKLERTEDDIDLIPIPLRTTAASVQRNFTVVQAVATF